MVGVSRQEKFERREKLMSHRRQIIIILYIIFLVRWIIVFGVGNS